MARRRSTVVTAGTAAALVLSLAAAAPAAVIREGARDTTFDVDGVATTSFGDGTGDWAGDLEVQPDGKVVVAGETNAGTGTFAVARYRDNGSLDPTFGGDGRVVAGPGSVHDYAKAVTLGPDGRIVVVGGAQEPSHDQDALVRLKSDGSLDPTFSGDGRRLSDWGSASVANGATVQPDGKIITVGYDNPAPSVWQATIARYRVDGSLDPTFSGDGRLEVNVGDGNDTELEDVAVQPDGKIVVGGLAFDQGNYSFLVMRLTATGGFDSGFGGGDGKVVTTIGTSDGIGGIDLMPDGRILAGGYVFTGDNGAAVARYLPTGVEDATFGIGGVALLPSEVVTAYDVVTQRNNRVLVAGSVSAAGMAAIRLNVDGTPDSSFGNGGVATTTVGDSANGDTIGLLRNGKVVVAGPTQTAGDTDFAVVRYIGDRTAPYDGHVIGLTRWSTSLRPAIYWQASDDNTGIRSFDVRQRIAKATAGSYGSFTTVKSATTLTAGSLPGAAGRTACVSTRGRDWAGNVGAYGSESCVAFPVDDTALAKTGSWTGLTGQAFYTGTARRSSDKGATLALAGVDYRHLALVATTCSGCGTVKVYLGKTLLATVKLTSSKTRNRVVIPLDSSLTRLSGTVRVKVATGGKPVVIDGLGVSLA